MSDSLTPRVPFPSADQMARSLEEKVGGPEAAERLRSAYPLDEPEYLPPAVQQQMEKVGNLLAELVPPEELDKLMDNILNLAINRHCTDPDLVAEWNTLQAEEPSLRP